MIHDNLYNLHILCEDEGFGADIPEESDIEPDNDTDDEEEMAELEEEIGDEEIE